MFNHPRPRPLILILAATVVASLVLLLLLAACGRQTSSPIAIVILPSATANEPAPALALEDRSLLENDAAASTQADAYIVSPTTGQATEVPLTPRRPDGQVEYGPQRRYLLDQNVNRAEQLVQDQATSSPFDLLNMIASAIRVTSAPGTLLILSSGLSTAGGFDLRQVGWDADPASIAAQLKQRRLLPDLAGWHVVFSGLGDTAGRQPPLPLPQRTVLVSYWMAICHAADAADCRADEMTRPDLASHSTTPVPVVPVPQVMSVRGPNGSSGVSVPSDDLFAFDSAALLPGTDGVLRPLVAKARLGHYSVTITGYASPDGGSAAYNLALSRARALAVRARLIALGLPAGQITGVTGLGTDGKTIQTCYVAGQFDEAVCAHLRRVVVLLIPPAHGHTVTA
jgi:outer membrane protein OmpA-like peptidoglycan-associated protein